MTAEGAGRNFAVRDYRELVVATELEPLALHFPLVLRVVAGSAGCIQYETNQMMPGW